MTIFLWSSFLYLSNRLHVSIGYLDVKINGTGTTYKFRQRDLLSRARPWGGKDAFIRITQQHWTSKGDIVYHVRGQSNIIEYENRSSVLWQNWTSKGDIVHHGRDQSNAFPPARLPPSASRRSQPNHNIFWAGDYKSSISMILLISLKEIHLLFLSTSTIAEGHIQRVQAVDLQLISN